MQTCSTDTLDTVASTFYADALMRLKDAGVPCLIGGAFAFARYTGVHREPITNSQAAEFEVARLGPGEKKTFTITLSGKGANVGIPRGIVKWERPLLGTGAPDLIAVSVPLTQ